MTALLRMLSHTLSERLAGRLWRTLLVLGLCLGAAAPASALDLFPLLVLKDEEQVVLCPLFVHEKDFVMLFPFYYRTNEGRDHHFMWPLIRVSEGRLARVMPVWFWGKKDKMILFPLMVRKPTKLWAFPYRQSIQADCLEREVWLLYLEKRSSTSLSVEAPTFPLPLVTVKRDDTMDQYRRTQALLYFQGSTATTATQTRWQGLFPLAYRWKESGPQGASRLWIFPYWRDQSTSSSCHMVAPFFAWNVYRHAGMNREFWLLPYVSGRSESNAWGYRGMLPFFYKSHGDAGEDRTRYNLQLLWPVYGCKTVCSEDGTVLSYRRRFLIFTDARDPDRTRTFGILELPIVKRGGVEPSDQS